MQLIFKFILLVGAVGMGAAIFFALRSQPTDPLAAPETVVVPAGQYSYRPAGDFRTGNRIVDAPLQQRHAEHPLHVMKFHVTQADYARCVADKKCEPSANKKVANLAQVNVSYFDAKAYAKWLTQRTGQFWRLPTDEEWVRAAGDRFHETALGPISNGADPSKRWIAKYKEEAARRGKSDPTVREIGHYGANNLGVVDINGNIWEWTTTCFKNGKVSNDGATMVSNSDYCGVRAAQGNHRAFIVEFVRDAKSGGCAVGIPPDNLGMRLVLDVNGN